MTRLFRTGLYLILLIAPLDLWSQHSGDFILAARRSNIAEIIDATTLETVTRLHFDFRIERMSGIENSSVLDVEGYDGNRCCNHYTLDLATLKLNEFVPRDDRGYYGKPLYSPDGRSRFRLKSLRGPALETFDLRSSEPARELIPPGLPAEDHSGNWAARGAWSGDRFYLYIQRPDDPDLLWTILPDTGSLSAGTPVAPFSEVPGCRWQLPVTRGLLAAGGNLPLRTLWK